MQLSPKKVLALIVGVGLPVVIWAGWVLGDLARPAPPHGSGAMGDAPAESPARANPVGPGRTAPGSKGDARPAESPGATSTAPVPTVAPVPTSTPAVDEPDPEEPTPAPPTPSTVPEESPTAEPSPSEPPTTPEASPTP